MTADPGRGAVREQMEQARQDFHHLLATATKADLTRPSQGTRWTNQQLLFHMLFGYLITRALLILARVFARLPPAASRAFARLLNSARTPFHLINYLGSCAGARIIPPARMPAMLDKVIADLAQHLDTEPGQALRRGMHYPTTWDPFFTSYMTLADIYRYPTLHFRHHQRQLTLTPVSATGASAEPVAAGPTQGTRRGTGGRTRAQAGIGLTPRQAKRFYDRLGRAQDLQAFYEDRAARQLIAAAAFPTAQAVFELGCGTGRLAENLLAHHLPSDARYLGADISDTMAGLSRPRLRRFGERAQILRADATMPLPAASGAFDRFVSVYVFDLLSPQAASTALAEARRLLRPGGLLCLASLAPGQTPTARLISQTWTSLWSRAPGLVGGCRPVSLKPLLDGWHIQNRTPVTAWGLTSEIIIATPHQPTAQTTPSHRAHPQPTDPRAPDPRP
jgi:ubiquinone/menaquinone biosynthesis C-methylase UbiE